MPLQATSGAASYDGFGGGVAAVPNYIEEVFSTYLYTGTGADLTITNNIDLSTKGGLVWLKRRSTSADNLLFDTSRGATQRLWSNLTLGQAVDTESLKSFTTTGFTLGTDSTGNQSAGTYASWTFREQPKFFDIVTWTGTGSNTTISHSLGSVPACIMVKRTDTTGAWQVYHRSLANTEYLVLNTTAAKATDTTRWNSTTPTSTVFSLGTDATVNASGGTYVAYIFAHDAGGFGLTGTDNVISCGSFTTDASGSALVGPNLGWEPQWVLLKNATSTGSGDWWIFDNMRGFTATGGGTNYLLANTSGAAGTFGGATLNLTSTGFTMPSDAFASGQTFIYIAIRRGPMKVPTSGTSVFAPVASRSSGTSQATPIFNAGFPVDTLITGIKAGGGSYWIPRLTVGQMTSSATDAESSVSATYNFGGMLGILSASGGDLSNSSVCGWNLKRAPSFHDVVCYTGNGTGGRTINHNLTVVPEMMIVKDRNYSGGRPWVVYHSALGATQFTYMNQTTTPTTGNQAWNDTAPTSSVFTLGSNSIVNFSGTNYVAYLFATCAGVSKVGSYTGTATTLQIDCGFTGGARFVLIHRTDSSGDWYIWDTARGIVSGNDPYLLLNSTAAETTGTDYIDPYSAGFEISSTAPAAINASGGTYIFLAIA